MKLQLLLAAATAAFLCFASAPAAAATIAPGTYWLHLVDANTVLRVAGAYFGIAGEPGTVPVDVVFEGPTYRKAFFDIALAFDAPNRLPYVPILGASGAGPRIDGFGDAVLQLFSDGTWTCTGYCVLERAGRPPGGVLSGGTFTLHVTPLPAALPLMATGLGLLAMLGFRRGWVKSPSQLTT